MAENKFNGTAISRRINGLSSLIGNTPLLEIEFLYKGKPRRIYAKAEYLNMTGSIKDRMALYNQRSLREKNHQTWLPGY
jgi:cysteine synthase A